MPGIKSVPKIKAVLDKEHLDYVSKQSCCDCQAVPLSLDPIMSARRRRVSDPHHLRNGTNRRRTTDWLTIPVCRIHHDRFHSDPKLERRNWVRHIRVAGNLLYRNARITATRFDNLMRCGDNEEDVRGWVDLLLMDSQNWNGGTI